MRTPYNLASSTLIGSDVLNHEGEKLGDIKEIILDADSARVSYIVLGFGGLLGISDKLFAILPTA